MDIFIIQLQNVINEYNGYLDKSKYDDGSDVIPNTVVKQLQTRAIASIERASGRGSIYF